MRIEETILSNLIHNEEYSRKVIPFINTDYFSDYRERIITEEITGFFNKYNKLASKEIISIEVGNRTDITDKQLTEIEIYVDSLETLDTNQDWLIENTEKFCKDKAVYNAILSSIKIIDGKDDKRSQEAIPNILSEALAVSFDNSVGHDYVDDADSRYAFYHRVEEKLPFDLEMFNKITNGGLSKKTLNVILAGCVHPNTLVRIRFRKKE